MIDFKEYEFMVDGLFTSCYSYEEGNSEEEYWIDSQNCEYFYFKEDPEDTGYLKDGRKHYIIQALKSKGVTENLVKWVVLWGPKEDLKKEWDFKNHKVYEV